MTTADRQRLTTREAEQMLAADRRIAAMAHSLRGVQGLGHLARSLRHLRFTLEVHFASEETPDGFFDMIRDRAGLYVAQVEQLRQEHVALLREVDALLDEIRACLAGPLAAIRAQASALADRIERHEARESDLLGDAMSTDGGAGDG
ncbi:MAG TPA: hypothetical protein VFO18_05915 [Methylomirabilota bacterium]|nr:hypothetical protein [Methylomirabilota bacterium]